MLDFSSFCLLHSSCISNGMRDRCKPSSVSRKLRTSLHLFDIDIFLENLTTAVSCDDQFCYRVGQILLCRVGANCNVNTDISIAWCKLHIHTVSSHLVRCHIRTTSPPLYTHSTDRVNMMLYLEYYILSFIKIHCNLNTYFIAVYCFSYLAKKL